MGFKIKFRDVAQAFFGGPAGSYLSYEKNKRDEKKGAAREEAIRSKAEADAAAKAAAEYEAAQVAEMEDERRRRLARRAAFTSQSGLQSQNGIGMSKLQG